MISIYKHAPLIVLTFVFLTATVALTLTVNDDATAKVVDVRSCRSVSADWRNCLTPNGGCPERMPPYKQWGVHIGNIPTCCCAPLKSDQQNFKWGQSLYR